MKLDDRENNRELSPADLRGILKYVPQWRGHTFVVAIDGSVFSQEHFANLMLELAVLRNLGIRIVIVYGIGDQMSRLAEEQNATISDVHGYGTIDEMTLKLAVQAAAQVGHLIEKGLTQHGLRAVRTNAVRATERGIIKGKSSLFSGKVDKIDTGMINHIMEQEWVPVLSPINFNKDAQELRLNSDALASDLAIALKASKLIFLMPYPGLTYNGTLRLNADVLEVRHMLDKSPEAIDEPVHSKALHAVKTIEGGTPRAHIIDSRIHDGLLLEIFSKVGIGSMIHSNPYSMFRLARKKDVPAIVSITKSAVRDEALRPRTRQSIENAITEYYVYEIDDSVIGCFRLTPFPRSRVVEVGSVFVHPAYQGRHIGKTMVEFAIQQAASQGKNRIVALTTQAIPFFRDTCGFSEGNVDTLPKQLRDTYIQSKRNSQIFFLNLT